MPAWLALGIVLLAGCEAETPSGPVHLTVKARADFGEVPAALTAAVQSALEAACPSNALTEDTPQYAAGLDCDGDGAPIAYLTPAEYRVAFKRVTFVHDTDGPVDVVPDAGTLAASDIADITQEITIADMDVPAGRYVRFEVELYFFEMLLEGGPEPLRVRVYLSDDDFPAEGSLGHHQGDITLVDEDGNELGWVAPGQTWDAEHLLADRGDTQGGGGIDAETGHRRGLYGDGSLWNQTRFNQGPDQDIYVIETPIDGTLASDATTITFVFDVSDTWFFEDFDQDGAFRPCDGSNEACAVGAAWGPLFREPDVLLQ
jgi:hypothetical protein